MIKQLAKGITSFLIRKSIIKIEDVEIYQYGTEQILINSISVSGAFIIATITEMWIETIFFFIGLVPVRMIAGGYHADTPIGCSLLTSTVYILNLVMINIIKKYMGLLMILTITTIVLVIIFLFAPVDHKHRVLIDSEKLIIKKKARIIGVGTTVFAIGWWLLVKTYSNVPLSTLMGAFTASMSLLFGHFLRR